MSSSDSPPATELTVEVAPRPYPVCVDAGVMGRVGEELAARFTPRNVLLVTDAVAGSLFGEFVIESLAKNGFTVRPVTLWGGEPAKNLDTIEQLYTQCAVARLGREGGIVALGGGCVSDIAGFAAATWNRGIRWAVLPTTLLAQVDASIGGKTAVNRPEGKNLIGAFHQPEVVLSDPSVLRSLPRRELCSGLAEVVKSAVIGDPELFALLETHAEAVLAADIAVCTEVVARAAAVKVQVVSEDEREAGKRAWLNLGHTLGHAVEAATGFGSVTHGEAVAMGTVAAARIAAARGLCDTAVVQRIRALCERLHLPVTPPADMPAALFQNALLADKKVSRGVVRWVLPTAIGAVGVYDDAGESENPLRWFED